MKWLLGSHLLKNTLKLFFVSAISNIPLFFIPIYIGYEYAVSKETDTFFLSYSIITFMAVIFSESVKTVAIPFLKQKLYSQVLFEEYVSTILHFLIKWNIVAALVQLFIFYIIYYFTGNELYRLLILSIPIFFFMIVNAFSAGILNSINKFYYAELTQIVRFTIIVIVVSLFNKHLGISAIIIGFSLGEIAKFLTLFYVIKNKYNIHLLLLSNNKAEINSFIKSGSHQVVASALSSSYPLISRAAASFLMVGSISILDYGDRLFMVFNVLLNSFLVIILSKWSSDIQNNFFDINKFNKILVSIFLSSIFILIIVYFSKDRIIDLLYPKLISSSKNLIAYILIINMGGFVFNSVNQAINRAIIASQATKMLFTTSIIKVILNIILTIILATYYGILGIAVSILIVHFIGLMINYSYFINYARRKYFFENIVKN